MPLAGSPAMLILVVFGLRFFGQGMTSQIAVVSMARWFAANRGRALAVAAMGFALGQAALPVLFVALLAFADWRLLWLVAAALALAAIPAVLWLLRTERTPQSVARDQQVTGLGGKHWTRGEVLRHPLIWLLVPMLLGPPAWGTALFFQQVHLAEVKGWSHAGFVALFPLFTLASVLTSLASGWAIDRFGAMRLLPGYMLPFVLGFLLLWASDTLAVAAVAMVMLGLAIGSSATLPAAFWAETYGTRHLGAIKAMIVAVAVFGSAVGPGISGWLIDRGVDFPHQMLGIAAYFVVAGVLCWMGVRMMRQGQSQG
jgi:MFS family permease